MQGKLINVNFYAYSNLSNVSVAFVVAEYIRITFIRIVRCYCNRIYARLESS